MNAVGRLTLYAAGLVVAFGAAFGISRAVVPDSMVSAWSKGAQMQGHESSPKGLSLAADGYVLSPIAAPRSVGEAGTFSFRVEDVSGAPVTGFAKSNDKGLHLIVVRSDGSDFRHVHPTLDEATGTWSIPWEWTEAGTYRTYADFVPTGDGGHGVTLTRTIEVGGDYKPAVAAATRVDEVDGFTASVAGDLVAGSSSELTITVTRGVEPVTTLEPYLGAFGHLVALRDGDLAYLHVHPEGGDARPGDTAGPNIAFAAEAPTAGRYLVYLDFQADRQVHTAKFVLDAAHGDGPHGGTSTDTQTHSEGH